MKKNKNVGWEAAKISKIICCLTSGRLQQRLKEDFEKKMEGINKIMEKKAYGGNLFR